MSVYDNSICHYYNHNMVVSDWHGISMHQNYLRLIWMMYAKVIRVHNFIGRWPKTNTWDWCECGGYSHNPYVLIVQDFMTLFLGAVLFWVPSTLLTVEVLTLVVGLGFKVSWVLSKVLWSRDKMLTWSFCKYSFAWRMEKFCSSLGPNNAARSWT